VSRFGPGKAYGHGIKWNPSWGGYYVLFWTVDRYYAGSRLRYPKTYRRDADEKGAKRFAKRHKIEFDFDAVKASK
jgi:hypothetical protein